MGKWVWFELTTNIKAFIIMFVSLVTVVIILGLVIVTRDRQDHTVELSFEELLNMPECQGVLDWEFLGHNARLKQYNDTQCKEE